MKMRTVLSIVFAGVLAIHLCGCESGASTGGTVSDTTDQSLRDTSGPSSPENPSDEGQQIDYSLNGVWNCSINDGPSSTCAFDGTYYFEGAYSLPALYSATPSGDGRDGSLSICGLDGNFVSGSYTFDSSDDFTLSFENGNVCRFSRISDTPAEFDCGFEELEAGVPFENGDFGIEFGEARWVDGLTYEDILGSEIASQIVEGAPSPLPVEEGTTYLVSQGNIENYTQMTLGEGQEYECYYLLNDEIYIKATAIGFTTGEDAFLSDTDIDPMSKRNLYACCSVSSKKVDEIEKATLFVVFHYDKLPLELDTYIFEIPVLD